MLERTEGAPQTPVPTDDEAYRAELDAMVRSGAITREQADQYMEARSRASSAAATAEYKSTPRKERASKRSYDNPRSPEEIQADMAELDVRLRGIRDDSAARRAEKERGMGMPSTEGYETRVGIVPSPTAEMEQEGQDMADSRMYGRRHGGGALIEVRRHQGRHGPHAGVHARGRDQPSGNLRVDLAGHLARIDEDRRGRNRQCELQPRPIEDRPALRADGRRPGALRSRWHRPPAAG